jgi:hypothetical protein
MTRKNFNTIIRKDKESYGAIINGQMFFSPVPFLFPQTVGKKELLEQLSDSEKETFEEFYCVVPIKVVDLSEVN